MYGEVQSVTQLSPDLVRVVLSGGTLDQFEGIDATDAYVNARFIPEGSPLTVPFQTDDLAGLAPEHRPKPRRYTIRSWDPVKATLTIDFVVHGDAGYAGRWALHASPGDRLQFEGPGGSYEPSPTVDWHLMAGDESAFGAIGSSLESLPPGRRAVVFALVEESGCEIAFPSAGEMTIHWLYRHGALDPESQLADAIEAANLPAGRFDAFVHGEAGEVREVRRRLLDYPSLDSHAPSISAYWRRNHTDEAWRSVKRQFMSA